MGGTTSHSYEITAVAIEIQSITALHFLRSRFTWICHNREEKIIITSVSFQL